MDDCDLLLSVEKASDWLGIGPGVTGNFLLKYPLLFQGKHYTKVELVINRY